jgi:hypothetical protein
MADQLVARLEKVSRGRRVSIEAGPPGFLEKDFAVRFDPDAGEYRVQLTGDGHFEESYRYLERWIARDAERRDGLYELPPDDHVDLTDAGMYWMLERSSDRLFGDLQEAIARHCEYLQNELYYMPKTGDVVIERRIEGLRGLIRHFDSARTEIRRAVLSPHTVDVLRSAHLWPNGDRG